MGSVPAAVPHAPGAQLIAWSLAALSAIVTARALVAGRARPVSTEGEAVDVLVCRPCRGADPGLERALRSTGALSTRHRLEVVFSAASAADPAWPVLTKAAEALAREGRPARAELAPSAASNDKCGQLAAVVARRRPAIVVVADADVDLTGFPLDLLIEPILRGERAASYAPPVEVAPPETLGDRASAGVLGASLHAFPLLARLDPNGFVGKLFAVHAGALAELGGFEALGEVLGEDMELARLLRARGHSTGAIAQVARARASGRAYAAVVGRFQRWIAVIRAQRPALLASYPLVFLATPLVALAGEPGPLALALLSRLSAALAARRAAGLPVGLELVPAALLADLTLALAFVWAIGTRTVEWRGRRLTLVGNGRVRAA